MTVRSTDSPAAAVTGRGRRPRRMLAGVQAAGGVAAQLSQAAASFTLQILAVRLLGLGGLGLFAVLYALIVLGTAISSGVVGDSLTVLSRHDRNVRAALQRVWSSLSVLAGLTVAVGVLFSWSDPVLAAAAGCAAAFFIAEDVLRRLLMANLRFWRIVVVDLVGLLTTVGVLGLLLRMHVDLAVHHFFLAMAIGQLVALLTAIPLLPRQERRWARSHNPDLRQVLGYGLWRAVQVSVKPTLLAGVRVGGLAVASAVAVGQLEAARLYLAPVLIVVGGLSTVMLARYAVDKAAPAVTAMRSADRAAAGIAAAASVVLGVGILARPALEPLITDGDFELPLVAVFGWALYAVATGYAAPYSTLAAVRCPQSAVVAIRLAEAAVTGSIVTVVFVLTRDVMWAPAILGVGSAAGGVLLRRLLLRQASRPL